MIWYATRGDHLARLGDWRCCSSAWGSSPAPSASIYSHELMHQRPKVERWLGDILLAMALYSHFRSEHLLVHHRYVGTPRDPVTARYNEGFHRFFPRVLTRCYGSRPSGPRRRCWRARAGLVARPQQPVLALLGAGAADAGAGAGGRAAGWGLALFLWQALLAVWQLELVNYIEHYGLTRQHLGDGKYEHVLPHHSLERGPQGVELAADQPAAPFRSPLQARPPVSAAADLQPGRMRRNCPTAIR